MEVKNLSVLIKDRFLVKNAYFAVGQGECWGILGEAKSGKTSLLKAVSGSLPISPGQVFIDGNDIYTNKKILRSVSTCFDPPVFFKYQTVFQNMKYISSLSDADNKEKIKEVLRRFNLDKKMHTRLFRLTYFEKKLMGLALGLLTEPKLLLLDEPFKNVPKEHLKLVKNAIRDIRKKGSTILMTSTSLEEIEDECDQFIFMEDRAIKKIMTQDEVLKMTKENSFAFIKVKYPHYIGKLLIDNFGYRVKILDSRVLFEADEEATAEVIRFLTEKKLAVYRAGYLNKKAEQVFVNLTPFFKEETP